METERRRGKKSTRINIINQDIGKSFKKTHEVCTFAREKGSKINLEEQSRVRKT